MSKVEQESITTLEAVETGGISNEGGLVEKKSSKLVAIVAGLGALSVAIGVERFGGESNPSGGVPMPRSDESFNVIPSAQKELFLQSQNTALPRKWSGEPLGRTTTDRPDQQSGSQIKLIYAVPSDGNDRQLDTNGTIETAFWNAQDTLAGKADRLSLRVDTHENKLDIGYLPLSVSSGFMSSQQSYIGHRLSEQLNAAGYNRQDKNYLVFYDGVMERHGGGGISCGFAHWPPRIPGNVATVNIYETACGLSGNPFSWYGEAAIVHESLHVFGNFPESSPRHDPANIGHTADVEDILNGRTISTNWQVDPGRDDYWNTLATNFLAPNHSSLTIAIKQGGYVQADQAAVEQLGTPGPECSEDCVMWFGRGALVGLVALPAGESWRFRGWDRACQGKDKCAVEISEDKAVGAIFEPIVNLNIKVRGKGSVRVLGQKACAKECEYEFPPGNNANLVARPAKGSKFVRWMGGCAAKTKVSCSLPMKHEKDKAVTAVFARQTKKSKK